MGCFIRWTYAWGSFLICDSIPSLACFSVYKSSSLWLYSCLCSANQGRVKSSSASFDILFFFFMGSLISVNFETVFTSSSFMVCKTLAILKNVLISPSILCKFSCVLAWISLTRDGSSVSGIFSIPLFVSNSRLILAADLKDLSNAGGVS